MLSGARAELELLVPLPAQSNHLQLLQLASCRDPSEHSSALCKHSFPTAPSTAQLSWLQQPVLVAAAIISSMAQTSSDVTLKIFWQQTVAPNVSNSREDMADKELHLSQ